MTVFQKFYLSFPVVFQFVLKVVLYFVLKKHTNYSYSYCVQRIKNGPHNCPASQKQSGRGQISEVHPPILGLSEKLKMLFSLLLKLCHDREAYLYMLQKAIR